MFLPLTKLNYSFKRKPILVGGKAMEYYRLRKAGADIDLIAGEEDIVQLITLYPSKVKDIFSDLGVCPFEFEIWRSIQLFKYEDLIDDAIEEQNCFIISLENLLILKSLAMHEEKYLRDVKLLAKRLGEQQYLHYDAEKRAVANILSRFGKVEYIEKVGPEEEDAIL